MHILCVYLVTCTILMCRSNYGACAQQIRRQTKAGGIHIMVNLCMQIHIVEKINNLEFSILTLLMLEKRESNWIDKRVLLF